MNNNLVILPSAMDVNFESEQNQLLEKIKTKLLEEEKGLTYYHIVVDGEYNRAICDSIESIYKTAGWAKALCTTSSESSPAPNDFAIDTHFL